MLIVLTNKKLKTFEIIKYIQISLKMLNNFSKNKETHCTCLTSVNIGLTAEVSPEIAVVLWRRMAERHTETNIWGISD